MVMNCSFSLFTPFPPYSSPDMTTVETSFGSGTSPNISFIFGFPPFLTA